MKSSYCCLKIFLCTKLQVEIAKITIYLSIVTMYMAVEYLKLLSLELRTEDEEADRRFARPLRSSRYRPGQVMDDNWSRKRETSWDQKGAVDEGTR